MSQSILSPEAGLYAIIIFSPEYAGKRSLLVPPPILGIAAGYITTHPIGPLLPGKK